MTVAGGKMPCSGKISLNDVNPLRAPAAASGHRVHLDNPHARWLAGGAHVPPLSKISMHDLYCKPTMVFTGVPATAVASLSTSSVANFYWPVTGGTGTLHYSAAWDGTPIPHAVLWAGPVTGKVKVAVSRDVGMPHGEFYGAIIISVHDDHGHYGRVWTKLHIHR